MSSSPIWKGLIILCSVYSTFGTWRVFQDRILSAIELFSCLRFQLTKKYSQIVVSNRLYGCTNYLLSSLSNRLWPDKNFVKLFYKYTFWSVMIVSSQYLPVIRQNRVKQLAVTVLHQTNKLLNKKLLNSFKLFKK